MHCQQTSPLNLNARAPGIALAAKLKGLWVRAVVERFDWKARAALRKKSRKSWDAIRQLVRYSEVVGTDGPISMQASDGGDFFRDGSEPLEEPSESD